MSLRYLKKILIATYFFVAITTHSRGETYWEIPPLPEITVANFAVRNEPFKFNTANAAGEKTFGVGKYSVSKTGEITGSATIEKYDINGASVGKPAAITILAGSKIFTPDYSSYIPIAPTNSTILGGDCGERKEQWAFYRANIIVKFSNGFLARGKITYEHLLHLYPQYSFFHDESGGITSSFHGYKGFGFDYRHYNISITGPKGSGHVGFFGAPQTRSDDARRRPPPIPPLIHSPCIAR